MQLEKHMFEYSVAKKTENGREFFEASTPYRQVVWIGDTESDAIGRMMFGVAELSRSGSIDPKNPFLPGSPSVQHLLSLLVEQLQWHEERRREDIQHSPEQGPGDTGAPLLRDPGFIRRNEILAALATSMAALARVKEL